MTCSTLYNDHLYQSCITYYKVYSMFLPKYVYLYIYIYTCRIFSMIIINIYIYVYIQLYRCIHTIIQMYMYIYKYHIIMYHIIQFWKIPSSHRTSTAGRMGKRSTNSSKAWRFHGDLRKVPRMVLSSAEKSRGKGWISLNSPSSKGIFFGISMVIPIVY